MCVTDIYFNLIPIYLYISAIQNLFNFQYLIIMSQIKVLLTKVYLKLDIIILLPILKINSQEFISFALSDFFRN